MLPQAGFCWRQILFRCVSSELVHPYGKSALLAFEYCSGLPCIRWLGSPIRYFFVQLIFDVGQQLSALYQSAVPNETWRKYMSVNLGQYQQGQSMV